MPLTSHDYTIFATADARCKWLDAEQILQFQSCGARYPRFFKFSLIKIAMVEYFPLQIGQGFGAPENLFQFPLCF